MRCLRPCSVGVVLLATLFGCSGEVDRRLQVVEVSVVLTGNVADNAHSGQIVLMDDIEQAESGLSIIGQTTILFSETTTGIFYVDSSKSQTDGQCNIFSAGGSMIAVGIIDDASLNGTHTALTCVAQGFPPSGQQVDVTITSNDAHFTGNVSVDPTVADCLAGDVTSVTVGVDDNQNDTFMLSVWSPDGAQIETNQSEGVVPFSNLFMDVAPYTVPEQLDIAVHYDSDRTSGSYTNIYGIDGDSKTGFALRLYTACSAAGGPGETSFNTVPVAYYDSDGLAYVVEVYYDSTDTLYWGCENWANGFSASGSQEHMDLVGVFKTGQTYTFILADRSIIGSTGLADTVWTLDAGQCNWTP